MFGSLLFNIFAFLVTIGILVTIHEFGHYWVARKMGVKVLRFSIGFGKPLWMKVAGKDKTEYAIAAIPLGGFVRMLDEREGEVKKEERHRAFNRQNVWKRSAIVAAGPMFNFFFAIIAYTGVSLIGIESFYPYVAPEPNSIVAKAGFEEQDKILAINDEKVISWNEARMAFLEQYVNDTTKPLEVLVQTVDNEQKVRTLNLSNNPLLAEEGDFLKKIGLSMWFPSHTVTIKKIMPNSAAEKAGLQADDEIIEIAGKPLKNVIMLSQLIKSHPNKKLVLLIKREQQQLTITVIPEEKQNQGSLGVELLGKLDPKERERLYFIHNEDFLTSLSAGFTKTWQISILTIKLMGKLITGEATIKNISGPVTIAQIAGQTAASSFSIFLSFLAIVSVSLGVLNLLPIPMLDGGHLLYYGIEIIKGSPVSERVEAIGFQIGTTLVAGLVILALYNDIMRLMN